MSTVCGDDNDVDDGRDGRGLEFLGDRMVKDSASFSARAVSSRKVETLSCSRGS